MTNPLHHSVWPHRILRLHAAFLIVLTTLLSCLAVYGLKTGAGPFAWVAPEPLAVLGLLQAYMLMFLLGVCFWRGASNENTIPWSLTAIAAHCVPLIVLVGLWNHWKGTGVLEVANMSFAIHGTWITVELISIVIAVKSRKQQ